MGWWLPRRGWLGHDGLTRHLNDLTRPTVPSGAVQERMLAEDEERPGVVGRYRPGVARAGVTGETGLHPTRTRETRVFGGEIV